MTAATHDRLIDWSTSVYSLALRVYPMPFQRRFGESMTQVFRESSEDVWRREGAWGIVRWWTHTVLDMMVSLGPAYLSEGRPSMGRMMVIAGVLYLVVAVAAVGYGAVRYGEFYRAPAFNHDASPDAHEDTLLAAYDTALGGEFGQYRTFAMGSAVTLTVLLGVTAALFGLWQRSVLHGAGALAVGGVATVLTLSVMPVMWFPLDSYPVGALWVMAGGPAIAAGTWAVVILIGRYMVPPTRPTLA